MNEPRRVDIATDAIFGLRRAVLEDPYTEPLLEVYGKFRRDSIAVKNVSNLATAEKTRDSVTYGNRNAKIRLDADEEASLASSKPGTYDLSKRIGQAHSHPYPDQLEPSKNDLSIIRDLMKDRNLQEWVEIIMRHRVVKPIGVHTYYMMSNGHPKLAVYNDRKKTSSMRHGVGVEIDFSAYYFYRKNPKSKLFVLELPVNFDQEFIEEFSTALPSLT